MVVNYRIAPTRSDVAAGRIPKSTSLLGVYRSTFFNGIKMSGVVIAM